RAAADDDCGSVGAHDAVEYLQDRWAVHPVEAGAHHGQGQIVEAHLGQSGGVALPPVDVGDAALGGQDLTLVQHRRLRVHRDDLPDVWGQRDGDLARPAAEVQYSLASVESEPIGEVGEQRFGVAGPVAGVVRGGGD